MRLITDDATYTAYAARFTTVYRLDYLAAAGNWVEGDVYFIEGHAHRAAAELVEELFPFGEEIDAEEFEALLAEYRVVPVARAAAEAAGRYARRLAA
jgi:hypothetical protein